MNYAAHATRSQNQNPADYFYSAATHRSRGVLWPSIAPAFSPELGPLHRLLPPVAGRHRVTQHLLDRLTRYPKLARYRSLTPALYQYCSPNPPIELHLEHPPVFHELRCSRNQLTKPKSGGLLLLRRNAPLTRRAVADFYSGAHMGNTLLERRLQD